MFHAGENVVGVPGLIARSDAAEADAFPAAGRHARERGASTAGICRMRSISGPPESRPRRISAARHRRVERRDVDASRIEARIGGAGVAQDAHERRAEHDEQDAARDLADDEGARGGASVRTMTARRP